MQSILIQPAFDQQGRALPLPADEEHRRATEAIRALDTLVDMGDDEEQIETFAVLVEAIETTGVLKPLMDYLPAAAAARPDATAFGAGAVVAFVCNLVNNLPLGLIAGTVASGAHLSPHVTGALLVGVDLGPNLSVTGSLATILWLVALRREGQTVSGWAFLKLGIVVMPLALIASLPSFIWLKV